MIETYKSVIVEYLNNKKEEVHFDEIYSVINEHFPKDRKSESKYLKEVITNRYKGSDTFYINNNNNNVGLKVWLDPNLDEVLDLSLFKEFQLKWDLEKVKNMKLEEYTNLERSSSFTYWIEKKLEIYGSIWGGSSFKFGIYKIKDLKEWKKKEFLNDGEYAWHKKYGTNREDAFHTVKNNILAIYNAVYTNNLEIIDNLDMGEAYKWKIAFHCQKKKSILLPVFKREMLENYLYSKNIKFNKDSSFLDFYKLINKDFNYISLNESMKLGKEIWSSFNESLVVDKRSKNMESESINILISYYLSRFNSLAYEKISKGNQSLAHKKISEILNIKINTVKNRRDKFDPFFWEYGNNRVGWHKPNPDKFIIETIDKYKDYTEEELYSIVKSVLNKEEYINIDVEEKMYIDGQIIERKLLSRKRNSIISQLCKERDNYTCQSCGFYHYNKIVEAHHLNPLYESGESEISQNDLVTLCPTCHRLAHSIIREEQNKAEELRINYTNKDIIVNYIKEVLNAKRT